MPAVAWLRQNTIGSLAAGSVSSRSGCELAVRTPNGRASPRGRRIRRSSSRRRPRSPSASPSAAVGRMPASGSACSAAARAKRCERVVNLSSRRSPIASSRKPLTSAAMRVGKPLASNSVIGAPPLRPASSAPRSWPTSLPTGVTRPRPVIATRRLCSCGSSASRIPAARWRPSCRRPARVSMIRCSPSPGAHFAAIVSTSPGAMNERILTCVMRTGTGAFRGHGRSPRGRARAPAGSAHRAAASPETPARRGK